MRRTLRLATIVAIATIAVLSSCEIIQTLLGGADTQAPTVSITSPAANAVVSGIVTLTAQADDDTGVFRVVFSMFGHSIRQRFTLPVYDDIPNGKPFAMQADGFHVQHEKNLIISHGCTCLAVISYNGFPPLLTTTHPPAART